MTRFFNLKDQFAKARLSRLGLPVIALALIASVVTGREQPSQPRVEPAARIDTRLRAASDADLDLAKLERPSKDELAAATVDPFSRRSFEPAAPAPGAAAQAPAKPTAPALPFTYLGKLIEDGKLEVFLGRGDDSYSVVAGRKIGSDYRVDKVTETSVTFTYLPLKTKQVLDIPAVN
jgi:hypothetical protein